MIKKITFVVVAGTAMNHMALTPFMEELKNQFTNNQYGEGINVTYADLPGHSNLEILPDSSYTAENYVQEITSAVEKIEGDVVLVGHSLGASILYEVAASGLKNVIGLVSVDGAEEYTKLQDPVEAERVFELVKAALNFQNAPEAAYVIAEKDYEIDKTLNFSESLEKIAIPTLLVYGENDDIAWPEYQERMAAVLDDWAVSEEVKNVGHGLPLEKPLETAIIVFEWAVAVFEIEKVA